MRIDYVRMPELANKTPAEALQLLCSEASGSWQRKSGMKRRVRYTEGMTKTQLFVANVNAVIEAEGLSVSEIARRADVARPELSKLLNGLGGLTIERAEKIATAIGVPLDVLIASPIELATAS